MKCSFMSVFFSQQVFYLFHLGNTLIRYCMDSAKSPTLSLLDFEYFENSFIKIHGKINFTILAKDTASTKCIMEII